MIKSKYRWVMPSAEEHLVAKLSEELRIDRLCAGVLAGRGWTSLEETASFLKPDADRLTDPFEMKGMAAAVDRIRHALREGEKIRVYGDYDADGVTSTALMVRLLTSLGANYDTYIPHRSREGYGLNLAAIDLAAEAGVRLLVTVDNGISAVEQIAYASRLGIDVVVTDHHEPPETLPEAIALVNPKQKDCPYPFKGLCGAGVVFKLAHAMLGRSVLEYADLAAIGTIADLMPLTGENRIIARLGLEQLRSRPIAGIRALTKASGIKPEDLTSGRIAFSLAPRLNAGGRLEHADSALRLLTAATDEEADVYAAELDRLNGERQALVEQTFEEADGLWRSMRETDGFVARHAIVLAKEGWNAGIAGLVASRFVEKYYLPAVILATDAGTGLCKGSARSIDGFDLYAALTECAEWMEHFGGHQAAAGLTMKRVHVAELAARLDRIAQDRISQDDWQPKRRIDLSVSLSDVTLNAVDQLARLEPFGSGNPTPRIAIGNLRIRDSRTMGKESKHLRLTVEQSGTSIEVVAFGMGAHCDRLPPGMRIDLLGELTVNEWNGNRKAQVMFQDYRSEDLLFKDRRHEKDPLAALDLLVSEGASDLVVVCASQTGYREAMHRFGTTGVPIGLYSDMEDDPLTNAETAAAAERDPATASASEQERSHLVLIGLPDDEQGLRSLKAWLLPERGLELVTVLPDRTSETFKDEKQLLFPDRKHFAEVYSMCLKRGEWLDNPDGFQQETALQTGWPLATVRMMHEVFAELGFIAASGASRKVVNNPTRKPLEESARYRKAREIHEAKRLPVLSTDELHRWLQSCHNAKPQNA
ncbi:single-stranded-DNA-specific exonuclease RecJ [Cohnella terricola]|nr:single-stranded-DNA-specific exonuclease RecJ [Cohnella terricola]